LVSFVANDIVNQQGRYDNDILKASAARANFVKCFVDSQIATWTPYTRFELQEASLLNNRTHAF